MIITQAIMEKVLHPDNRKSDLNPLDARLSGLGLCQRKQVLASLEGVDDIAWEFSFGGKLLQEALTQFIEKKYDVMREYTVHHPYGTGHIDLMIGDNQLDRHHIIECKSQKCASLKGNYEMPKRQHLWQVKAQMLYLSKDCGYEPTAEIFYGCRDHFLEHNLAFEVDFPTKEEQSWIDEWLKTVFQYKKEKIVPDIPFPEPVWECEYSTRNNSSGKPQYTKIQCPFFRKCWEGKE